MIKLAVALCYSGMPVVVGVVVVERRKKEVLRGGPLLCDAKSHRSGDGTLSKGRAWPIGPT